MWQFFQKHDYKKTMKSVVVWKSFCKTLSAVIAKDGHYEAIIRLHRGYALDIQIPDADFY
jgi:hypothetical protein